MGDAPDFLLFVVRETLSDKSIAFNVVFGEHKLAAVDEAAAEELAQSIADAINDHTTQTADVVYE